MRSGDKRHMNNSDHKKVTGLSISFFSQSCVILFFYFILEIFKNSNNF